MNRAEIYILVEESIHFGTYVLVITYRKIIIIQTKTCLRKFKSFFIELDYVRISVWSECKVFTVKTFGQNQSGSSGNLNYTFAYKKQKTGKSPFAHNFYTP